MWGIELDRSLDVSLKRQIYQKLRDQMMNGTLKEGSPLPSTRELAQTLSVSRNTVNEAYDMLIAEGYAQSRQGAPTRVVGGLILDQAKQNAAQHHQEGAPASSFLADFKTGQPDLRQFPRYVWQRVSQKALGEMPMELLGYGGPQGLAQLREEIAAWLLRSKGLTVDTGDIYITAGATQALHLVADLLHTDHPEMLAEDPCNIEMIQTFIHKGYTVTPVPVDGHGLQTDALSLDHCGPIYVTPSHQFPLGGILPAARRAALIRFARRCGSYVIEDDYDSEYRYYGEPATPLYAMAPDRVIYIGTFSKVLFPALRIGYVLVPRELQSRWRRLRTYTDVQNPPFEQAALAEFLRTRKFDRHIARMKKLYRERRQALFDALGECFGERWRPWGDAAGLQLAVEFSGIAFDDSFREQARRSGIRTVPVEYHSIRKGRHTDKLLLGYGHLEPDEIRLGVHYIQQFINDYVQEHTLHR
ncbi:GntR family transcriptional regulator/MocR family aminotransferase [Paenibacillus rhizosphaerae]|uniref:GntR family transcriptional regulator/MocR family aminotransferase n=1 Tax=Paenibacillus rhizosphaerae TaxID=297318 RepID=A0A839TIV6_9BACL|nr:PLP-dependent aminotransferase family protein [Paenibacillus rhizosphaerae]MBB3126601.1 GntR family transcriptional regulator/MocR family aminotransferase [Paenibacillus rhizosphaerae]